jgi:hypothetical protein
VVFPPKTKGGPFCLRWKHHPGLRACLLPGHMLPRHGAARHRLWRGFQVPHFSAGDSVDCVVAYCSMAGRTVVWRFVAGHQTTCKSLVPSGVSTRYKRGTFSLGWLHHPGLKANDNYCNTFSPGSKVEPGLKGRTKGSDSTSVC